MTARRSSHDSSRSLINILNAVRRALLYRGQVNESMPGNSLDDLSPQNSVKQTTESGSGSSEKKHDNQESGEGNDTEKLEEVAKMAHEVLYKTDTVFPFTLFPDTIIIEREKVNIAKRFFFRVAKIIHIPVRDLLNVEADVGPFFGSIHITSRFFTAKPFTVNFLWRKDALKLQTLLQGYIIAYERDIEATNIEKEQLVELLEELGAGETS